MTEISETALVQFAEEHHIDRLTQGSLQALLSQQQGYTIDKAKRFVKFQKRIDQELLTHPVILNNEYCKWFQHGSQSSEQIKAFIIQFSVFSNLFLLAQLNKMINADSLESMRASKEILANEIGVIFNSGRTAGTLIWFLRKDLSKAGGFASVLLILNGYYIWLKKWI